MSWAELLRRSAKYARKSLAELAASLKPPLEPQPVPSYERAFSRYRQRGPFLPPLSSPNDHQRRWFSSSCTMMKRHAPFFRGNVKHSTYAHEYMMRHILNHEAPLLAEFYAQHHQHWKAHHRYWHRRAHGHHRGFRHFKRILRSKLHRLIYLHLRQFKRFARCVAAQSHYNAPAIVPVATYFHHYLPTMWHASSQNYLNANGPLSQLTRPCRTAKSSSALAPSLACRFTTTAQLTSLPNHRSHSVESVTAPEFTPFGIPLDLFLATTLPPNAPATDPVTLYHAKLLRAQQYIYPVSLSERALLHELLVRIQRFRAKRECPITKLIERIQLSIPQLVDLCIGIRESVSASLSIAERTHIKTAPSIRPVELLEQANYAMLERGPKEVRSQDRTNRNELSNLPSYRSALATADIPISELNVEGLGPDSPGLVDPFSAAVDFSIVPRLTLPNVSELTESTLESVRQSINSYISRLQTVMADITKLAEYGELPLSIEMNNTTLRVHFPNSDTDRVNVLLADKEVDGGEVVEIVNPSVANDHENYEIETISDFSSGVTSIFSSESSVQNMWTQVTAGPPDLTANDSSLSDEHESSLLTLE